MEEFHTFTQTPAHHLRALDHLGDEFGDLLAAKVKPLVEGFERFKDLRYATNADNAMARFAPPVRRSARRGLRRASHFLPLGDRGRCRDRVPRAKTWIVCGLISPAKRIVASIVSLVSPGSPRIKVPWIVVPSSRQSLVTRRAMSILIPLFDVVEDLLVAGFVTHQ